MLDTGRLEVPEDVWVAGWWHDEPEPGEPGASVITGHSDDYQGPALFISLKGLNPGDLVAVGHADGTTTDLTVQTTELHDKDAFPTDRVYSRGDDPVLRLVTCGGGFTTSVSIPIMPSACCRCLIK